MKTLTISRDSLLSATSKAILFVDKKPVIPIFDNFLLRYDGTTFYITASTGGSTQITTFCQGDKGEPFSACVPARLFHGLISTMVEPEVTISSAGKASELTRLVLNAKTYEHKIPVQNPLDFPLVTEPAKTYSVTIKGSTFIGMASNIVPLINERRSEIYPQFSGVNMTTHEMYPGCFIMQGGSGFCFAVCTVFMQNIGPWQDFTVDYTALKEVKDIIEGHQDVVITHDGARVSINTGTVHILSRKLEGKFPEMITTMRKKMDFTTGKVQFSSGEVAMALKRLEWHKSKDEAENNVVIRMEESNPVALMILDNNLHGSHGQESVTISGDPSKVNIAFSFNTYTQAVKAMDCISFEMLYGMSNHGAVMRVTDSTDNRYDTNVVIGSVYTNQQ